MPRSRPRRETEWLSICLRSTHINLDDMRGEIILCHVMQRL